MAKKKVTKKTTKAESPHKKIERSFPRTSLSEAIRIPLAIKEYNGGNSWPPNDVKAVVESSVGNASVKSNQFYYLTAASRDFGLTEGTRDASEISLTDLGRKFAYAGTPDAEKTALTSSFLSVEIFKKVFSHYKGKDLPEKKYVANTLEGTFGLHPEIHDEFLELYRENIRFLGDRIATNDDNDNGKNSSNPTLLTPVETDDGLIVVAEPDGGSDRVMFVAMPFRERQNDRSKGFFPEVLKQIIGPAGADAGFKVITANQRGTDVIQSTIVNGLFDADLVLADLTEHNPNVLFELGVRMAIDKPVALIRSQGTDKIFDVDNMLRVFDYSPNLWKSTVDSDIPNLSAHIKACWDRRNSERTYMKILRSGIPSHT